MYHAAMVGRRHHSQREVTVQLRSGNWKHEPPQKNHGRRFLIGSLVAAGVVLAAVLADEAWSLRDSVRRLVQGEEIPAFRAKSWEDARSVRESLAEDLLTSELTPSVDDWDTRRDLALHTLIVAVGEKVISEGGASMGALMEELCLDVDWLEEMVWFCHMEHAEDALPILAHLYGKEKKKMAEMPANRRFASAVAFEFARAGLDKERAHASYLFYMASGQKHWLNNYFPQLALWEMSVIAARFTDAAWNSEETLTWFQRNSRLPARGYVTLGATLGGRERCLFGEPVDTPSFLSLYRDSAEGGVASIYEASGCSTALDRAHYAATAACANGVPALVASSGTEAVCLVDVNGRWESSAPAAEGMSCSWSFMGQNHPHFVELASRLGAEKEKTLASARLAQMGQFLYDSGNQPLAHSFFREALKVQPLNYAAWVAFRACGAPQAELDAAAGYFEELPGVAAVLAAMKAE